MRAFAVAQQVGTIQQTLATDGSALPDGLMVVRGYESAKVYDWTRTGFVRIAQRMGGRIEVLGRDVTDLPAYRRHRLGLGRTFQAARLYDDLTVRQHRCRT